MVYNNVDQAGNHSAYYPLPSEEEAGLGGNGFNPISTWDGRAIQKITDFEENYISRIPNLFEKLNEFEGVRVKTEAFTQGAEKIFLKLESALYLPELKAWLEKDEFGHREKWTDALKSFAFFLAKLPFRVARNIIMMLTNIVKAAVYAVAHPVQALTQLAKMIVKLLESLTHPDTWTKMGAGMVGASLGQAAVGNPLVPIGLIIGAAMLCGGVAVGALVTAIKNRSEDDCLNKVGQEIAHHLKQVPEAMLTGFLMGLMFGAIQKSQYNKHIAEIEKNKWKYASKDAQASWGTSPKVHILWVEAQGEVLSWKGWLWMAPYNKYWGAAVMKVFGEVTIPHVINPLVQYGALGVGAGTALNQRNVPNKPASING